MEPSDSDESIGLQCNLAKSFIRSETTTMLRNISISTRWSAWDSPLFYEL